MEKQCTENSAQKAGIDAGTNRLRIKFGNCCTTKKKLNFSIMTFLTHTKRRLEKEINCEQ